MYLLHLIYMHTCLEYMPEKYTVKCSQRIIDEDEMMKAQSRSRETTEGIQKMTFHLILSLQLY